MGLFNTQVSGRITLLLTCVTDIVSVGDINGTIGIFESNGICLEWCVS